MGLKITTKGFIELFRGSTKISQHTSETEALERASLDAEQSGATLYTLKCPNKEIDLSRLTRVIRDIDVTRPTTPSGFGANPISATQINLLWTASTDPQGASSEANTGVQGYRVYRNGSLRTTTTSLSFSDTGLTEYTLYSYYVTAIDGATPANESIPTATLSPRTFDVTAPTAPVITASVVSSTSISVALTTPSTDAGSGVSTYRLEYKRAVDSTWTLNSSSLTSANFPRAITGLTAGTSYDTRCRATDVSGNVGNFSATSTVSTSSAGAAPVWNTVPTISFFQGTASNRSIATYVTDSDPLVITKNAVALPTGVTYNQSQQQFEYNGVGAIAGTNGHILTADDAASGSWASRIADPGVVWYHGFTSAEEVNAFRWTGGFGVDPNAVGSALAPNTSWVSSGGPNGHGYMQILRPGLDGGGNGLSEPSDWWRPLSPMTGASNGRGIDDPGANGTLTPQTWNRNNANQLALWMAGSKPGWYGHSSYQNSFFDGTEFYIQQRVMNDPRSSQLAGNGSANELTGKFNILAVTAGSNVAQTHVILQRTLDPNVTGVGAPNYHNAYVYQNGQATYWGIASLVPNPASDYETQPGRSNPGACLPRSSQGVSGCWSYALDGTWDTLMYHVRPGTHNGSDSRMTVYAAHQGETSYTVIADFTYNGQFEQGGSFRNGFNAWICMAYNNGFTGITYPTFWTRFADIIFSKSFIACPT